MATTQTELWYTISFVISVSISIPTTLYILGRETWNRRNPNIIFASKWLYIFSILCIGIGPIAPIIYTITFVEDDRICTAAVIGGAVANILQLLFLEWFQLSRLHYCFSRDSVHSIKGYSRWLFVIMYTVVTVEAIFWAFSRSLLIVKL